MPYRAPNVGRQKDRERYHRRVAERPAAGLCTKFGKRPPAPDRSICRPCAGKARAAGRARDARLRSAGQPRRNKEKARAYERERSRRQTADRIARGICTKCGTNPAEPARRLSQLRCDGTSLSTRPLGPWNPLTRPQDNLETKRLTGQSKAHCG